MISERLLLNISASQNTLFRLAVFTPPPELALPICLYALLATGKPPRWGAIPQLHKVSGRRGVARNVWLREYVQTGNTLVKEYMQLRDGSVHKCTHRLLPEPESVKADRAGAAVSAARAAGKDRDWGRAEAGPDGSRDGAEAADALGGAIWEADNAEDENHACPVFPGDLPCPARVTADVLSERKECCFPHRRPAEKNPVRTRWWKGQRPEPHRAEHERMCFSLDSS